MRAMRAAIVAAACSLLFPLSAPPDGTKEAMDAAAWLRGELTALQTSECGDDERATAGVERFVR